MQFSTLGVFELDSYHVISGLFMVFILETNKVVPVLQFLNLSLIHVACIAKPYREKGGNYVKKPRVTYKRKYSPW